jgi:SAM-dependent methyltransferase
MERTETDPLKRFSSRVDAYIKYRPDYPDEVLAFFKSELGLSSSSVIADVGSGTGILSGLFLRDGNLVFGVEPNREMREAAERLLAGYANFKSIEGSAEATTLENESVDFVVAAQAFHWFNPPEARAEFTRILKPQGFVALIWNNRREDSTPFLRAYEKLLDTYSIDYQEVKHQNVGEEIFREFFEADGYKLKRFDNHQDFDYEGLKGRVHSASYTPMRGHANYEPMIEGLERIFSEFQENGTVRFEYDTEVYYGHLAPHRR